MATDMGRCLPRMSSAVELQFVELLRDEVPVPPLGKEAADGSDDRDWYRLGVVDADSVQLMRKGPNVDWGGRGWLWYRTKLLDRVQPPTSTASDCNIANTHSQSQSDVA
ncbi:hypothetical protein J6590_009156 [Homalodisca vitripennis]|nr:hypothetical protein J6590_009156 [Homalodisca vitripennis]